MSTLTLIPILTLTLTLTLALALALTLTLTLTRYRIANGPAPALRDASRWSNPFHAFVGSCLRKGPKQRASVAQLLAGPWCAAAATSVRLASPPPPPLPLPPLLPPAALAAATPAAAPAVATPYVAELPPILWAQGFDERMRIGRVIYESDSGRPGATRRDPRNQPDVSRNSPCACRGHARRTRRHQPTVY